jgi:hypothetical protein
MNPDVGQVANLRPIVNRPARDEKERLVLSPQPVVSIAAPMWRRQSCVLRSHFRLRIRAGFVNAFLAESQYYVVC